MSCVTLVSYQYKGLNRTLGSIQEGPSTENLNPRVGAKTYSQNLNMNRLMFRETMKKYSWVDFLDSLFELD